MTATARCYALLSEAAKVFPKLNTVVVGSSWDAGRKGRAYAYCEYSDPPLIVLSPRLDATPSTRVDGVIRHEIGHAVDALYSRRTIEERVGRVASTPELMADDIAEALWGPIRYDGDHVQTTGQGVTPRPQHLPK